MIYQLSDYRRVLEVFVERQKERGIKYTYEKLAEALRIQKSYLSKVLSGQSDLNQDQLYLAAREMELSKEETDFLSLLLEKERSSLVERRKELDREIQGIQKQYLKTDKHIKTPISNISLEVLSEYYLDPWLQILHIALSIENFRKAPLLLGGKFSLSKERVIIYLKTLEKMKLIEWKGEVKVLVESLHLPRDSSIFWAWRTQLINMGTERSKNLPIDESYNFSVVFSGDEKTRLGLQKKFLLFLQEAEKMVSSAKAKGLYQMNFDLFPWV
jgi:transcriptional regulator with XRE-family HTH domain